MSNDMKLIMEEWRKALCERTDDLTLNIPRDERGMLPTMQDDIVDAFVEVGKFTLEVLDPTGYSSWDDLEDSWRKYTQELDLEDPVSVKTFVNASMVLFDAVDSIPWVALYFKPITVPTKLLRVMRRAQKATRGSDALKPVNKLAKRSADKLENKLSRMISQKGSGLANFRANERYYKKFARSFSDNITGKPKDFLIKTFPFLKKIKDPSAGKLLVGYLAANISAAIYQAFSSEPSDFRDFGKALDVALKERLDATKNSPEMQKYLNLQWRDYQRKVGIDPDYKDQISQGRSLSEDGYKDEVFRNIKNTTDTQLIVYDIENQMRKDMGDELYGGFEADPETGRKIAKKGQSDAAKRAAERTMKKRAEDLKNNLFNRIGFY